jgi:hypothetical protein
MLGLKDLVFGIVDDLTFCGPYRYSIHGRRNQSCRTA